MKRCTCALLLTGAVACAGAVGQEPASLRYFPPEALDDFEASFYGDALRRMGEAPLAPTESPTREVYRFLWAPSFDALAVVRRERDGDRVTVSAARLPREADGERLGSPDPRVERVLSLAEWSVLSEQLATAQFWSMTAKEPERRDADGNLIIGLDGDTWILEGADAGRRHVVARWHHEAYPAFEAACYCMLGWSGLVQSLADLEAYGDVQSRLTTRCT